MHKEVAVELRKFNRSCLIAGYKEESIRVNAAVVVQTDRGIEFGKIVDSGRGLQDEIKLKKILRYATAEDIEKVKTLPEKEKNSLETAVTKVREHELPVRIVDTEYLFDGSKLIIYYKLSTGEKAVNLRDLSRDLSTTLKARVEMKQISPRDEARFFGGLGTCGRELCCCSWLKRPKHVTVKMAKEQGYAISPTKTSGMCGRLMCCLGYEYENKTEKKGGE